MSSTSNDGPAPDVLRRLCVFCGSSSGTEPAHRALATALGRTLAAADVTLVYGGGAVGLMGITADSVLAVGGEVIGVIPTGLFRTEVAHEGITELHRVPDMHARKALMYDLADAFVVLPGGLGTFEELFEAATWNQLGLHGRVKPIVLLDDTGFFAPLVAMLDTATEQGFVKPQWRGTIASATTPAEALSVLRTLLAATPPDRIPNVG